VSLCAAGNTHFIQHQNVLPLSSTSKSFTIHSNLTLPNCYIMFWGQAASTSRRRGGSNTAANSQFCNMKKGELIAPTLHTLNVFPTSYQVCNTFGHLHSVAFYSAHETQKQKHDNTKDSTHPGL
jgi:hypothetical protein